MATRRPPVGFLDSGIGGLPYLERSRELLPGESFVYLADRENFPYGVQSREQIREIVIRAASILVDSFAPGVIVVACNTASVVSLAELRSRFSIPFVGVVPAIKPAGETTPGGRIGVLATERTVEDPYLSDLVSQFAPASKMVLIPAGNLVEVIEGDLTTAPSEQLVSIVRTVADRLVSERVDAVVLGCTHFVHIRDLLQESLGPEIRVHDSVEGVSRQLARVWIQEVLGLDSAPDPPPQRGIHGLDRLVVTGEDPGENYRNLASRYRMEIQIHDPVR